MLKKGAFECHGPNNFTLIFAASRDNNRDKIINIFALLGVI